MRPGGFRRTVAEGLAAALLDGEWSPQGMRDRATLALGRTPRWLSGLVRRVRAAFADAPRDSLGDLSAFVAADESFRAAFADRRELIRVRRFFMPAPVMARTKRWNVPDLATTGDVANWLGEPIADLDWLADWRGLSRHERDSRTRHYVYRWMPKRTGGFRLLEAPKPRLKAVQRRVLHDILDHVPAHEAAHGFRTGRSVLTHAYEHVGRCMVLRLDLEDFFASVPSARVYACFRSMGYPEAVARVLCGLCTSRSSTTDMPDLGPPATATTAAARCRTRQRYITRHLPQGAPTSPALANLCAYGLDVRLAAAARSAGAVYTRYADDLAFSGDQAFARRAAGFSALVGAIAIEEGFHVQHRKTRLMPRAQRQEVTGLVVNAATAVRRDEYDRLRAILHNCMHHGPEAENRTGKADFRAHLQGAVAWVSHVQPVRGAKLRDMFDRIEWARD